MTGFSSYRWIEGAIVCALLALAAIGLEHDGYHRAETKYELQISNSKVTSDKVLADAREKAQARIDAQAKYAAGLAAQLITAGQTIDQQTKQLKERKNDVSTLHRDRPTDTLQRVPAWIASNGWVCDYNRATGDDGMPAPGAAAGRAASEACQADPFGASRVDAVDILGHHEDYAAYCRKLDQQVDRLLNYIDSAQGDQGK